MTDEGRQRKCETGRKSGREGVTEAAARRAVARAKAAADKRQQRAERKATRQREALRREAEAEMTKEQAERAWTGVTTALGRLAWDPVDIACRMVALRANDVGWSAYELARAGCADRTVIERLVAAQVELASAIKDLYAEIKRLADVEAAHEQPGEE